MTLSSELTAGIEATELDRRLTTYLSVATAAAVLRLSFIGLWPELIPDEGFWTIGAKNFVQFGDWFHDGGTHFLLSPFYHLLVAPLFAFFGSGIAVARYVSAVAGIAVAVGMVLLVHRVTDQWRLAAVAGLLAATNEYSVLISRTALMESLVVALLVGTAITLTARARTWRTIGAATFLGLALLTKFSAAIFVVIAAVTIIWENRFDGESKARQTQWSPAVAWAPIVLGLTLAGVGYGLMFVWQPDRFLTAFAFEMNVASRVSVDPLIAVGRFGFVPIQSAESVLSIVRQMPFLTVLATVGFAIRAVDRFERERIFAVWLILGSCFYLFQVYQPIRYFYLNFPPLVYFAATALEAAASEVAAADRRSAWWRNLRLTSVVGVYVLFEFAYILAGVAANRGSMLPAIERFGHEVPASARLVGAPYLCVNVSQECLPHRTVLRSAENVTHELEKLGADYVIVDQGEWSHSRRQAVEEAYPVVERWSFGAAYRVIRN